LKRNAASSLRGGISVNFPVAVQYRRVATNGGGGEAYTDPEEYSVDHRMTGHSVEGW